MNQHQIKRKSVAQISKIRTSYEVVREEILQVPKLNTDLKCQKYKSDIKIKVKLLFEKNNGFKEYVW